VRTPSVLQAGLRGRVTRPADHGADADDAEDPRPQGGLDPAGGGDEAVHDARVEGFASVDARLASPLLGALEERGPYVFAVVADGNVDLAARRHSAEPLPCGTLHSDGLGSGGSAGAGIPAFNERACLESGHRVEGADAFAELLAHELDAVSGGGHA
jgi:hypothetical protein